MKQSLLAPEEVLAGYDAVSHLYPHVPSMCIWRAWEYAAYQRYSLTEPVLDVGCGDGRFFRLLWPHARDAIGVDSDLGVAALARPAGVYRDVRVAEAHAMPFASCTFASAFANCSLEHMDRLPDVLNNICRCLRPGGSFLLSVVTDKFLDWATLPLLGGELSGPARAEALRGEYKAYHHLVSPLPPDAWSEQLGRAGFHVLEHIPLLPELSSRFFLFMDHLWHLKRRDGELGDVLHPYLMMLPGFPQAFRHVLAGVLGLERVWSVASGAVFWVRRAR